MERGPTDPLSPASQVTAADLRRRVEARWSYRLRVVARLLVGRPLRRYPPPSWKPAIVAGCVVALACFAAALWYLAG